MKNGWLFFLILLGSVTSIEAQTEVEETIEVLERSLQSANTADSIRLLTTYIIDYGGEARFIKFTIPYGQKLIRIASENNLTRPQHYAVNALSFAYGFQLDIDSMSYYAQASQHLAEDLQIDSCWAMTFFIQSNVHLQLHQYDSAMHYIMRSVEYYERETVDMPLSLANAYRKIATIIGRSHRGGNEESLHYARKALEACTDEVDPYFRSRMMISLAVDFGFMEMHDSVYHYVQLAIERGRRMKHYNVVGSALHLLSEYYFYTDRYEEALQWVDTVQQHYREYLSINQIHNSLFTRSEAYYHLGRYQEALEVADELMISAKEHDVGFLVRDLSKYMSDLYATLGRHEEALELLRQSVSYSERIFHEQQAEAVSRLEKKFESAQKDKALALAEQSQVEQALVFQRRSSISLVVFLLCLMLAVFLFWRSRLRTLRAEKEASDLQQRLLRSQMNPHFAYNTLGSIQNYLLQSGQSEKAAYYLAKFAKLMRQLLDQSRTSQISLEEEMATLNNYLSLQQIRYENKFSYELNIDPNLDLDHTWIPPMLIQPVIENAIEHGKVHTIESGKISVDIHPEGSLLKVFVRDNGVGRQASVKLRPEGKPESVATSIIQDRIRLMRKRYGHQIAFAINYPENGGAQVSFQLPYIQKIES